MLKSVARQYQEAYSGLPRVAWMLAAVDFVNSSGTMVIFFMTLYLVQKLHYSLIFAGRVLGVYGVGSLVGAYLGGWFCDRLGPRSVQGLGLLFLGVSLILLSFFSSAPAIILLMFAVGMFSAALFPANATALAQVCPAALLTKGFSLGRLARNLGVTIGPVVGGFLALLDYRFLFWVDGLTSLAAAGLFAYFFRVKVVRRSERNGGDRSPWHDFPFLFLILLVFVLAMVFNQIFSTLSLYMRQVYGFRENRIGQLLAVNTVMIVFFEMLLMHGTRRTKPLRLAAIGALCLGGGFALMPVGRGFLYAGFTVAVWTMGEMLTIPTLSSFVAGRAGEGQQGRYQGFFSIAFSLATILGPLIGTRTYERFGPETLWHGSGVVGILLAIGFFWIQGRLHAVPADN